MPVHDWNRVDAGVFHDFHNVWIGLLRNALNMGVLPPGYYAMSEQHAGKYITDVLTLHGGPAPLSPMRVPPGGVAVVEAPPKVRHHLSLSGAARSRRKTLAIRHVSDDRIIALMEIVSPANKDRHEHVAEFVDKVEDSLAHGIHVLVVVFPPAAHDPNAMHGAIWDRWGDPPVPVPSAEPLTLASYVADTPVKVYLEQLAVGSALPEMPLFLDPDFYVNAPLEATYQIAWRGTPSHYREILEPGSTAVEPHG